LEINTDEPIAKARPPNMGSKPIKYPNPIPPKDAWAIPPDILINFFSIAIVPIMPVTMLARKAAIKAFCINV
jgi:hypothetical protein